ncbi:MAG: aspartate--tRNA ligase [Candidatus Hatepunaea meridiana]|nr:aspartate--tRNA ligase [Candidatus Hatepunaea meridiana]
MTYRTHTCSELNASNVGQNIKLAGWTARKRDLGGFIFIDLRDKYGKTQVVFDQSPELAQTARELHSEDVVQIEGTVRHRPDGMVNRNMKTGEIEVTAAVINILSRANHLPLEVEDEEEPGSELRLRYRYLDLRRPRMRKNLLLRHKALQSVRNFHTELGFIEVETPFLIRSTPEGARDYIVPSRERPGSCYSLPQSPQLYKQALMIGGIDKYFQLARCFRDEDLRRDRQPEFTQIDVEMSFVEEEDVFTHTEAMMQRLVKDTIGTDIQIPFPRIEYDDAISKYGSDAPDMRYELLIKRCDDFFSGSGFKAFENVINEGGGVFGICAKGKGGLSRKERERLEEPARTQGLAGLLSVPFTDKGLTGIIGKLFKEDKQTELCKHLSAEKGDLLLFAAGKVKLTLEALGRLRRKLAQLWDLEDKNELAFCWVVNPPLFEPIEDSDGITAVHHPFTAPNEEDIDKLESDPLNVYSRAYDLVLNGIEMSTGSIRIHDPELQQKVFKAIGIDNIEAKKRFGFLLEALSYGAPPHAGIALGFDRLVMLLAGETTIRNIIAFPKTNVASSLMDGAPAEIEPEQLRELGLKLIRNETAEDAEKAEK